MATPSQRATRVGPSCGRTPLALTKEAIAAIHEQMNPVEKITIANLPYAGGHTVKKATAGKNRTAGMNASASPSLMKPLGCL